MCFHPLLYCKAGRYAGFHRVQHSERYLNANRRREFTGALLTHMPASETPGSALGSELAGSFFCGEAEGSVPDFLA